MFISFLLFVISRSPVQVRPLAPETGENREIFAGFLFYFPQSSYSNLFWCVAECYAFSCFHDNVGLRDLPSIRHIKGTDAVIVNIDALVGNAVLLFSVVHLNMVDQLCNHPLCNGGRVRVSPYRFKKIVNVHALALVLFQFQPQRLDLLGVLALLLFIAFGHLANRASSILPATLSS